MYRNTSRLIKKEKIERKSFIFDFFQKSAQKGEAFVIFKMNLLS